MYTYKFEFPETAETFVKDANNLTELHAMIVPRMTKHDIKFCKITCSNGVVRTIRYTGQWHWKHNGYQFN